MPIPDGYVQCRECGRWTKAATCRCGATLRLALGALAPLDGAIPSPTTKRRIEAPRRLAGGCAEQDGSRVSAHIPAGWGQIRGADIPVGGRAQVHP